MKQLDGDGSQLVIPTLLLGTANGVIGVVAQLPRELFVPLEQLQVNLTKVIRGIGGTQPQRLAVVWQRAQDVGVSIILGR